MNGKINSIETLGTLDGPGIRYVVFMQGCSLRCKYCHNPETWDITGKSTEISATDLVNQILKYKNYFGTDGGVTFSGGEPLLQPEFLLECLKLCKQHNINTCIDTAGVGFGDYKEILKYVDLVILDIKAVDSNEYQNLTGKTNSQFSQFLKQVIECNNKLWLRQVIVPGINNTKEHVLKFKEFAKGINNVQNIELLPYKTIGVQKYKELNINYPLENVKDLSQEELDYLNTFLK